MRLTSSKLLTTLVVLLMVPTALAFSPPKKTETKAPAGEATGATVDGAAAAAWQSDPLLAGADVARGKNVYQRVGVCVNCHGWDGNGMGQNPRSEGDAADLRDTELDTESLISTIACGIPGTPMPYHLSAAYKDPDLCFGMVMADFEAGAQPRKGKTFRDKDIVNLVAYLYDSVIGAGETTLAQCEAYFEPGSTACDNLR